MPADPSRNSIYLFPRANAKAFQVELLIFRFSLTLDHKIALTHEQDPSLLRDGMGYKIGIPVVYAEDVL